MTISRNRIIAAIPLLAGLLTWLLIEMNAVSGSIYFAVQLLLFVSVMFIIWQGSNLLVNSSQDIAEHFQVSPFLIGLTIVAFGTSVPEMVTSLVAGLGGKGDIAVANVVGSNILNISVILGGLALFTKGGLAISRQTIRLDAPILILGTLLILMFVGRVPMETVRFEAIKDLGLLNLKLDFVEAIVLLTGFALYFYIIIARRKRTNGGAARPATGVDLVDQEPARESKINNGQHQTLSANLIRIFAGLAAVMLGCHVLVGEVTMVDGIATGYGAVWFASIFGLPDYLIGLSIVALGTSAPEIVVSLSAVRSNALDVGIGNLLGSALFNLFAVLGIAGLVVQPPLAEAITINARALQSLIAMGLLFVVLLIFLATKQRLSRREGLVLFSTGVAYMIYEMVNNLA